jgi:hypothetical protein
MNYRSLGYFRLEVSSTAKRLTDASAGLTAIPANAKAIEFSVETNDVRRRLDAAPTASEGVLHKAGPVYVYEGPLDSFQVIAATGSAVICGEYFGERNPLVP